MANLESYLVRGFDLSTGERTWLSDDLSAFSSYFVTFIWNNVTGTLDGSLLIRDTDDDVLFESLETVILDTSDESRERPNINLKQNKLSVKFTPNGITGGRLSIKIRAVENKLQAHNTDKDSHCELERRYG